MSDAPTSTEPAMRGFDAVAYFEQGRAIEGSPAHEVDYAGTTWRFASGEHAESFRSAPERYVPAYEGQCAFATSLGKTEAGDPRRWAIKEGRLFLNSNAVAHQLWKLIPGRIAAADRTWKAVTKNSR